MNTFPFTPDGFLNPVAAAIVGLLISLWLKQFLGDWRYRDLLLLLLCISVEIAAGLATDALRGATWFTVIWLGFLGASVATFGYETIVNLLGVVGAGPRTAMNLRAQLGDEWRQWK